MADVALRDYLKEIDGLIEHNAYDTAIHHCRHILGHYPKYVEAYRLLGKALLEKEDDPAAVDVFQRVLGVDPEDFVARVGLSIIYDRRNELDKAIWHMERAFDLTPSNEVIQSELRRLYGRRDGVEPERISLTHGALARMYAAGDLYSEAIADLRALLQAQPERIDLQVLLAEVLWRDDQRIDAAEWAQKVINQLPYCLNANLILADLLRASGEDGESELPLKRAQAVDPDNAQAARFFGSNSPLPSQLTTVPHLEQPSYGQLLETEGVAAAAEEVPDWLRGLADLNVPAMIEAPESAVNPPLPTGLHMPGSETARGEIPDWLQGLEVPQEAAAAETPAWMAALGTAPLAASAPARAEPELIKSGDEEVPDWIRQLGTGALDQTIPATGAAPTPGETPDWMKQLGTGMFDQAPTTEAAMPAPAEEMPDWLRQLGTGALDQAAVTPAEAAAPAGEMPDWLRRLGTGALDQAGVTPAESVVPAPAEEVPDWLARLGTGPLGQAGVTPAESVVPTPVEETPDWLARLGTGALEPSTAPAAGEAPDWLAELRASAPPSEEVAAPPITERKIEVDADRETVTRLVEAFEKREEPVAEVAQPVEAAVPEEMMSPDDALAFFARLAAGKEEQLRAEAEQEGAARMETIMGRKPVEAAKPAPPIEEAVAAPVIEMPAAAIGEAEMIEEAAVPIEEAGEVTPIGELPEWLRAMQPEAEIPEAAAIEEAAAPIEEAMEVTPISELPEWLRAVQPEAEIPETAAIEEAAAPIEEAMEVTPISELPEWLRAMQPTEPAAEITPAEELPEWLRGLQPGAIELEEAPLAEAVAPVPEEMAEGEEPLVYLQRIADEKAAQLSGAAPQPEAAAAPIVTPVPAPIIEMAPAPIVEAAPAPAEVTVPEEMLSPEAALAFFASLSAGKEDELRKQAEAEAVVRMDEIMGRKKTGPLYVRKPEPQPIVEEVAVAPAEAAPIKQPVEEIAPAQPIAPVIEAAPAPAAEAVPSVALPVTWWIQTAEEEGEEPLAELPMPLRMPRAEPVAPPSAPRPKRERAPRAAKPSREEKRAAPPVPALTVATVNVDPLVAHLESNKHDHAVRLELARAWWSMGNRDSALEEYTKLTPATELSDEVIADLERIVEIAEQADWARLLGDMYMKNGKLARALEMYRRALSQL